MEGVTFDQEDFKVAIHDQFYLQLVQKDKSNELACFEMSSMIVDEQHRKIMEYLKYYLEDVLTEAKKTYDVQKFSEGHRYETIDRLYKHAARWAMS